MRYQLFSLLLILWTKSSQQWNQYQYYQQNGWGYDYNRYGGNRGYYDNNYNLKNYYSESEEEDQEEEVVQDDMVEQEQDQQQQQQQKYYGYVTAENEAYNNGFNTDYYSNNAYNVAYKNAYNQAYYNAYYNNDDDYAANQQGYNYGGGGYNQQQQHTQQYYNQQQQQQQQQGNYGGYYDQQQQQGNYGGGYYDQQQQMEQQQQGNYGGYYAQQQQQQGNYGGYYNNQQYQQQQQQQQQQQEQYQEPEGSFYFDGLAECTGSSYNLLLTDLSIDCNECEFNSVINVTGTINTTSALPRYVQIIPKICDGSGSTCTGALLEKSYINLCQTVDDCKEVGEHHFQIDIQIPYDDGNYVAYEEGDEATQQDQYQDQYSQQQQYYGGGGGGYLRRLYGYYYPYQGKDNSYNNFNYNKGNNNRNRNYYNKYHSFMVKIFIRPVTNFNLWKALTGNQDDDYWEHSEDYPEWWVDGYTDDDDVVYLNETCSCPGDEEEEEEEGEPGEEGEEEMEDYYNQYYANANNEDYYYNYYNDQDQNQQYADNNYYYYYGGQEMEEEEEMSEEMQEQCDAYCEEKEMEAAQQVDDDDAYNWQYQQWYKYYYGKSVNAQSGNYRYRYYPSSYYQEKNQQEEDQQKNTNNWRQDYRSNPSGHMYCYMHFGLVGRGDLNLTAYSPGTYSSWWKSGRKYYNYNDFRRYFRYVFASVGIGSLLALLIHATGKRRRLICACDEDTTCSIKDKDLEENDIRSGVENSDEKAPPAPADLVRVPGNIPHQCISDLTTLPPEDRGRLKILPPKSQPQLASATAATNLLGSSSSSSGKKKRSRKAPKTNILPPKPKGKPKTKPAKSVTAYVLFR